MHAVQQLQVAYQRLEDHCSTLWEAMPMTTGLISEQSGSQCSRTGHRSPVCRTVKLYSPRLFSCQELLGFILNPSILTTFAAAPEFGRGSREWVCSQSVATLGIKATFRTTGKCWSYPVLGQLLHQLQAWRSTPMCFFPWRGGWKRKASSSIWRFCQFSASPLQLRPSCFALPSQMEQGPKIQLLRWKHV